MFSLPQKKSYFSLDGVLSFLASLFALFVVGVLLWGVSDAKVLTLPPPTRVIKIPKQIKVVEQPKYTLLGVFELSRYYSPTVEQTKLLPYEKSKAAAVEMNCNNGIESCKTTANGYTLSQSDAGKLYSCPQEIPLWSEIKLEFHWGITTGICLDRGGAIKNKRLDSYCGLGNDAIDNINGNKVCQNGKAKVFLLEKK